MNILFILSSTNPQGGATKAFMSLLGRLVQLGVHPAVVVPSREGIYHTLTARQIPVLATPLRMVVYPPGRTLRDVLLFLPRLLYWLSVNRRSVRAVEQFAISQKADLVHTNVSVIDVGFRVARRLSLPHVYHLREYGREDFGLSYFPSRRALSRQLAADSCYSVCITKDIQRHHGQQPGRRSRVIYDGVSPARRQCPAVQRESSFLYAGRIEPAKGLDLLLEAYDAYCRQTPAPWPLYVAGSVADTVYADRMKRRVSTLPPTASVHFLGLCTDLDQRMQRAGAIVVPSRSEGFGLCMAEAMFNGCLVIGHDTGGTKEQFDNGLLATGREIGLRYATTSALAQLLADVSRRPAGAFSDYTAAAFTTVNQLYTDEQNAQQVYALYTEILQP